MKNKRAVIITFRQTLKHLKCVSCKKDLIGIKGYILLTTPNFIYRDRRRKYEICIDCWSKLTKFQVYNLVERYEKLKRQSMLRRIENG